MTNKLPVMPVFVDDYLADTKDFSLEEHGAYLLLLMHMWRNGGTIAYDETRIARMLGAQPNVLRIVMRIVMPLLESYVDSDGNTILSQRRLTKEIKYTRALKARQSLAGRKAALAKRLKNQNAATSRITNRSPTRIPNRSPTRQPPKKDNIISSLQVAAREDSPHEGGPARDTADQLTDKPAEDKSYLFETEFMKRSAGKDS